MSSPTSSTTDPLDAPEGQAMAWVRRLPQRALVAVVQFYRLFFKAWLGNACRFEPSCSQYALDALEQHGALTGGRLAAGRLLRCHPGCVGGCDPVPSDPPRLFTSLLRR
jgi:putative membrane protein insertion efficiency factor